MLRSAISAAVFCFLPSVLLWAQAPKTTSLADSEEILSGTLTDFQDVRSPSPGFMELGDGSTAQRITQRVNLHPTILKYAAAKQISIRQARIETFMFLGLASNGVGAAITHPVRFEKLATDVVSITATEDYFRRLPARLECLALGKKFVRIQAQLISIAPRDSERVSDLLADDSVKVEYGHIPDQAPLATSDGMKSKEFQPFLASSTVTRQCLPVTTGRLTKASLHRLNDFIRDSSTAQLVSNPILSAMPGEASTISTLKYQPYLVGVSIERDKGQELATPTIQTLEEGTTLRVKAFPKDGKIQLSADIAMSEVRSSGVFHAPKSDVIVQQPSQRIRQVHLATEVLPGETVFIDPNLVQRIDSQDGKKKSQAFRKVVVLLTAAVVDGDEVPAHVAMHSR